ncbi:MAG: AsmA-like C-terminal domain-containing protein [Kiloniellales bacterium]|nr:AsmA-like C-terminal domain-containing protein [Kiloniellales bacterium]
MIARSAKILTEVIVGVIAVAALITGLFVWRLSTGPVPIDFLTPYLENSFADNERGLTLQVEETVLDWGQAQTIELRARDVRIVGPDGATIAAVPDVKVTLSLSAMLRGMIAATEVEVVGARLTLVREADGRFALAAPGAAEEVAVEDPEPELSAVLPALIDLFTRDPERGRALDYLNAVRVVDGQFIVVDRRLKAFWFAPDATMELRRHERGVAAVMDLEVAFGAEQAKANLAVLFDLPQQKVTVAARVAGFHADAVAAVAQLPEAVSGLHVPVEANVQATLTPQGKLTWAKFDVTGGAGTLSVPPLLPRPKPVAGLEVRGQFDGAAGRLEITTAELDFGTDGRAGPSVSLTAAAVRQDAEFEVTAEARVSALPVAELGDYWPAAAAPGAREWVTTNIPDGLVENGRFSVAAKMPEGRPEDLEIVSLDGGFEIADLEVHYLRPLPPITGITGRAALDGDDLKFQVDEAEQGELAIRDTRVDILDMAGHSRLEIVGTITGPVRAALELLDHERLDLLARLGFDPASASGVSETELAIDFPLLNDLTLADVNVGAKAAVKQGSVAGFLLDRDASDMDLDLAVDGDGLSMTGPLRLAGVPLVMDWREDFTGQREPRTSLALDFPDLGTAGRRALGLDLAPYVEGPVSVAAIATLGQDRQGALNIAANLADARLSLPFLRWHKPAGEDGALRVSLALEGEAIAGLNGFDVTAGTLAARGGGELRPGAGDFRVLRFDEVAVHGTALRDASIERVGEGLVIDLGEGVLDAAPFVASDEAEQPKTEPEAAEAAETRRAENDETEAGTPVKITGGALEAIYFDEGRYLRQADLYLERSEVGWERVELHGEVPEALWRVRQDGTMVGAAGEVPERKTFDLAFGPAEEGLYRLDARTNDMGAGLRALGIIDTIEGGELVVTATSAGPAPNHPLEGRVEAEDYVLRDAPVMAQLLSLASLTGISNVLDGEGLRFKRLTGDFRLADDTVSTDLFRAYGNALGLTAKGTVDFGKDAIEIEGTVVPAYTVNRILGEIPILGPILVGGKGEGIVAVVYGIDGPLGDPQVSVNPLSVLTPGFLRGIFGIKGGEGDSTPRAMPGRVNG